MKLEQNEKQLLFSETVIPDIFFAEHLSQIPGDYLKIYLYLVFLSKYKKDITYNDLYTEFDIYSYVSSSRGRAKLNTAPPVSAFSAFMTPPWALMIV